MTAPDRAQGAALPPWQARAGQALEAARKNAPFLLYATPQNLQEEMARCARSFGSGQVYTPAFRYRTAQASELADDLMRAAESIDKQPGPLAPIYSAAAREIALERALCERAGQPGFAALAAQRFGHRDRFDSAASELALHWLDTLPLATPDAHGPLHRSDDESDPESLISQLRKRVGALRLPFRVRVSTDLAARAATGHGLLLVAPQRMLSKTTTARLVVHEVEGHARPQAASLSERLALFRFGSASGFDDQEGRALWLEERSGHFGPERKRRLALRHLACDGLRGGADFAETVRQLRKHTDLDEALAIAARCWRGGGLCREHVYLGAYLRFAAAPQPLRQVLKRGAVSLPCCQRLSRS